MTRDGAGRLFISTWNRVEHRRLEVWHRACSRSWGPVHNDCEGDSDDQVSPVWACCRMRWRWARGVGGRVGGRRVATWGTTEDADQGDEPEDQPGKSTSDVLHRSAPSQLL